MRKAILYVLVYAAVAACSVIPKLATSPPTLSRCEDMAAVYWEVDTESGIGSCVAINTPAGLRFLTAAHVVEGAKQVELRKELDGAYNTRTLAVEVDKLGDSNKGPDLALLKPKEQYADVARTVFDPSVKLTMGEDVWYVGTPRGMHQSFEKSIVNNPRVYIGIEASWLHFSFNGNGTFGNSGGPVFVKRGGYTLAGILTLRHGNGVLFGENADTIAKFLGGAK